MIIQLFQTRPIKGETEGNLDRLDESVRASEADLIVLPELFASGYFFDSTDQVRAWAEPVPDGPTTRRLEAWARVKCTVSS